MKLDGLPPFYFHYSLLRSDCTWHSHHLGRYNEVRYLGLLSCVLVLRYRRCIQFEVVCGSTSSSLGSTLVCISFISSAMGSEWNCNYTFSFFITIGRTCSNYAFSRQEDVYAFREREGDPASSEAEGEDERGETEEFPHWGHHAPSSAWSLTSHCYCKCCSRTQERGLLLYRLTFQERDRLLHTRGIDTFMN